MLYTENKMQNSSLPFKVFINFNSETEYEVDAWAINNKTINNLEEIEAQRVTVQRGNLSFSLVLDSIPRIEVWNVDAQGELQDVFSSFEIQIPKC